MWRAVRAGLIVRAQRAILRRLRPLKLIVRCRNGTALRHANRIVP